MKRYIKCLDQVAIAMSRLVLFIVSSMFFITCSSGNRIKITESESESDERIDKSLLLHKIKNETLKAHIARYDSMYNEGEQGISIWCQELIPNGAKKYTIAYYDPSTLPSYPMIKCEPINGREIIMVFFDYANDIELAADKTLELNKDAISPKNYKEYKKIITSNKKKKYEEHIITINDRIGLGLTFDKDQNLIKVDTLGFY